jgi:hypothetical protein
MVFFHRVIVLAEIARDKVTQIQAHSNLAMARNREVKEEESFKLRIESEQALIAKDAARDAKSRSDQVNHQRSSLAFANLQRLQQKQDEGDAKKIKDITTAGTTVSPVKKEDGIRMQMLSSPQAAAAPHVSLISLETAELAA